MSILKVENVNKIYGKRETEEEVIRLLMSSKEKYNQTIVMITHKNNIAEYADRVINIKYGFLKEHDGE
ncbi:MAG: hypothetical protein LBN09_07260 [Clostridioides sp.]|jgi:putative ABC transport system ATP-binding protein|nr:hypothetical protein [Clostridioides sp.]